MTRDEGQRTGWSKAAQRRRLGRRTASLTSAAPEDKGRQHEAEDPKNKEN